MTLTAEQEIKQWVTAAVVVGVWCVRWRLVWNSQEVRSASCLRTYRTLTHIAEVIKREERRPGKPYFKERRAYSDG